MALNTADPRTALGPLAYGRRINLDCHPHPLNWLVGRLGAQSDGIALQGLPQERANRLYQLIIGARLRVDVEGEIGGNA
jgi:hypothetical protein